MKFKKKWHFKKEILFAVIVVLVGNIAGFTISFVQKKHAKIQCLERNPYGQGSYDQYLKVHTKNQEKRVLITVEEELYGKKKREEIFLHAQQYLEEWYQEQVTKKGQIQQNLDFPNTIENSPVQLSWSTEDPQVLDWEGRIQDTIDGKGETTKIYCNIGLGDESRLWEKEVKVFPLVLSEEEYLAKTIQNQAEDLSKEEEEKLILPDTIDGESIWYEKEEQQQGMIISFFSIIIGLCIPLYAKEKEKEKDNKRKKEMMEDYPDIVEKLVIYLKAGFSIRKAMEKLVLGYLRNQKQYQLKKRAGYEELVRTCKEMEGGMYEQEAYERMGKRYGLANYKMLSVLLVQNLRKGNKNLLELLEREVAAVTEERKRNARVKGEEASIKLLLPMVMQLIVVLVILMVPAFLNFL